MTLALPARSEPRVEVATNLITRQNEVLVWDSKDPQGGQIAVTARRWTAFTEATRKSVLTS